MAKVVRDAVCSAVVRAPALGVLEVTWLVLALGSQPFQMNKTLKQIGSVLLWSLIIAICSAIVVGVLQPDHETQAALAAGAIVLFIAVIGCIVWFLVPLAARWAWLAVRWTWYFALNRIKEMSQAVRGKDVDRLK